MALKLLNPGLRPLGMFDLEDDDAGLCVGGEFVQLQSMANDDVEAYAADVGQLADTDTGVNFTRARRVAGRLGGLADEGGEAGTGYGTLFGSMIGSNTGRATSESGAVVIGPDTARASGKVTVWAQAGLYGVTDQTDAELDALQANAAVHSAAGTGLLGNAANGGAQVGIYVGAMTDTSLVSTTNAAVGLAAATEFHTVFYQGN
jgi:hypothetical protein